MSVLLKVFLLLIGVKTFRHSPLLGWATEHLKVILRTWLDIFFTQICTLSLFHSNDKNWTFAHPRRWRPWRRRREGRVDLGGPPPALPLADVEVDLGVEVDEQAHRDHAQHEQLQSDERGRDI